MPVFLPELPERYRFGNGGGDQQMCFGKNHLEPEIFLEGD
jgi:hypothetical protein